MTQRSVLIALAATALLGGCTQYGAWNSAGMWQPTGSNSANLRAMVADPNDLSTGRGSHGSPGDEAARAVTNLETGKTPAVASTSSSGRSGAGGMSSGGAGSGGTGVGTGP